MKKQNKAVTISKDIFICLEYLGESSTNYLLESLKKNQCILETSPCHLIKQERGGGECKDLNERSKTITIFI